MVRLPALGAGAHRMRGPEVRLVRLNAAAPLCDALVLHHPDLLRNLHAALIQTLALARLE